jgi:hypothetical protein
VSTTRQSTTIRIFRTGNGKATVQLSPQPLQPGETFVIKNFTECRAAIDFSGAPITPPRWKIPAANGKPGKRDFEVDSKAPCGYYEYDITLLCIHGERRVKQYVEGGSKPGVIIDP